MGVCVLSNVVCEDNREVSPLQSISISLSSEGNSNNSTLLIYCVVYVVILKITTGSLP